MGNISGILERSTQLACSHGPDRTFHLKGATRVLLMWPTCLQSAASLYKGTTLLRVPRQTFANKGTHSLRWNTSQNKTHRQIFYLIPTLKSLNNMPNSHIQPINTRPPKSFIKSVWHKRQLPQPMPVSQCLFRVLTLWSQAAHLANPRISLILPLVTRQHLLRISFTSRYFIISSPQTLYVLLL